jgi:hypothetical protein
MMKTLRQSFFILAALAYLVATTGCSVFRKDKKEDEDDGLTRWNEGINEPSRWQRWKKWENEKSEKMWERFRDS